MNAQDGRDGDRSGGRLERLGPPGLWVGLLLAAGVWMVFCPVRGYEFVNLDDPAYVSANPHVQGGLIWENVLWAFRTGHAGNWHPLTWLSHMLDAQWFGHGAAGPHVVNLAFHLANTVLLFFVLRRMTGALWRPALVAALFGCHPLRVESVAWVAERKDVLSGFFFMLTIWAYARYAQRGKAPAGTDGGWKIEDRRNPAPRLSSILHPPSSFFYALSLLLFALGLMSKPIVVTLPFVLLLLDYWPLQRLERKGKQLELKTVLPLFREKIPFFALSALSCVVTFLAQRGSGAVQSLSDCPFGIRLENGVISYLCYLGKTVWPAGLATPYPEPHFWPLPLFAAAVISLAGMTVGALWLGRREPFAATGWLWFLGTLVPVIGIVQVGAQGMADRYTYLPLIGIFILVAWGVSEAFARWHVPTVVRAAATGLVLLACLARTKDQLRYWQNSEALLSHAVAVTSDNWFAHYNLGWELDHQGRTDEALPHYRQAVEAKPYDTDGLIGLGGALFKRGQYAEALPYFETALKVRPDLIKLHYNLGRTLLRLGRTEEAVHHYQVLVQHQPEDIASRRDLGVALALKGEVEQAIGQFRAVLQIQPDDAEAHFNLGEALALQGKTSEAIAHLKEALRLKPGWDEARRELRELGAEQGRSIETGETSEKSRNPKSEIPNKSKSSNK